MPTYEYYCSANHKTVEVMHGMTRTVSTWGELCELAEESLGKTSADEPVEKLMGTGMIISNDRQSGGGEAGGACCSGGGCGCG